MTFTREDLIDVLAHNAGNDHDDDIVVLHENGEFEIVPDQTIEPLQNPFTWPKYVGRAQSINKIVQWKIAAAHRDPDRSAADGLDDAVALLDTVVRSTIATNSSLVSRAGAVMGRFVSRRVLANQRDPL